MTIVQRGLAESLGTFWLVFGLWVGGRFSAADISAYVVAPALGGFVYKMPECRQ